MDSLERFRLFDADNRLAEQLAKTKPTPDYVLAELFIYRESGLVIDPTADAILGDSENGDSKKGKLNMFPFAKVLVDSPKFKAGDIIKLSNDITKPPVPNPEYDTVVYHNKAYPNDKRELPPQYLGEVNIIKFLELYSYDHRPFRKRSDKNYVVLIPTGYIECVMDKEMMLK